MAKAFLRAVAEMEPGSLIEKIKIAQMAISERLRDLGSSPGCKDEKIALHNAIQTLRTLKSVLIDAGNLED